ncbi:sugar transferase [Modicisalibacter xianhensis]|uniref:Exopolysaccharide biosynthesis polyprenyl glycosylphosphotransferase n=1 Tax=Modicisalibacter xianhensis TaxID=442341 RepID=A0A1I3C877_9GAMM|nr:sugar transferase [Halomonas xianhensis]SFH70379.1 exopolysaccharide biosynthesis polyprenyl glycosylphosphotransferase [Halomonas xianhensis]
MDISYERRHSRWYEKILLGMSFQLLIGLPVIICAPAINRWGWDFWMYLPDVRVNTLAAIGGAFLIIVFSLRRLLKFPGVKVVAYIAPTVTICFLISMAILFFARERYSRQVLFTGYLLSMLWFFSGYFIGLRYRRLKLAVIPVGQALNLLPTSNIELRYLKQPTLNRVRVDGIVADLHDEGLTAEWEKFLAKCTLSHIPVYHIKQIKESITGRVEIEHLSENAFGTLLPSPMYSFFKRVADIALVLIILPLTLPVMLITAIIIKLDSPGPVFFTQDRVGQGNRSFKIYKFRSMAKDSESNGARLAQSNDMRITRIGRFIRKTRLDEFPQFYNVLRGDMSLIGPRPEQRAFVDLFEEQIPFYIYRHVVKPGITGWAQVVHGYASDADDTRIKIQHDFYYIKNFSFWLDVLIVFKTIKTLLTGFGAK